MEDGILRRLQEACEYFRKSDIESCQTALRERLTEREWKIVQTLAGFENAESATDLHTLDQTVRDCEEEIYRKLEVRQRSQVADLIQNICITTCDDRGSHPECSALWAKGSRE